MSTQTDVKSAYLSASGFAGAGGANPSLGTRLKGIWLNAPATAGSVVITDGSSTGVQRLKLDTDGAVSNDYIWLPGEGIRFNNDMYVTLTNVTSVTLFYG